METCANCTTSLASEWKFCIRCGTRVQHPSSAIPGAIRPSVAPTSRRRLTALGTGGMVAGGVLVLAALVVLAVVINNAR